MEHPTEDSIHHNASAGQQPSQQPFESSKLSSSPFVSSSVTPPTLVIQPILLLPPWKKPKVELYNSQAAQELLEILSMAILPDGGASLVVAIKDYVPYPKRIDALLVRAIGSKKLLSFLEYYTTIFQVDRNATPHFVKLLSHQYCTPSNEEEEARPTTTTTTTTTCTTSTTQSASGQLAQDDASKALKDKVLYVLRKRSSKLKRRQREQDFQRVTLLWLLKECTTHVHFYLRAFGFYRRSYKSCHDVHIVGTDAWQTLVLPEFETFLTTAMVQQIEVYHDTQQALFNEETGTDADFDRATATSSEIKSSNDEGDSTIQSFARKLMDYMREDGGTHVTLSLMLHRNDALKGLLGGRDFLVVVQEHQDLFQDLLVTKDGPDIYLQIRPFSCNHQQQQIIKARSGRRRLTADEQGLFSVASSKWGTAMANLLVWGCSIVFPSVTPHQLTAIDLTASVGGITLCLAKANFAHVIGVEIDSHRAQMCRQNMETYGMAHTVDVYTADAMEFIPRLVPLSKYVPGVVVIDPPWGGIHYKRGDNKTKPLQMGPWAVEEVVETVVTTLLLSLATSAVVLGIRFPVTYAVYEFIQRLKQRGSNTVEIITLRRLGPQLFLVLVFRNSIENQTIVHTGIITAATK